MKQGLDLDRVVLLGRTFEEYVRFFALNLDDLRGKAILDVAAGVSSFCAEAKELGLNVTAMDRIYELPWEKIQQRCVLDLDFVSKAIGNLNVYRWDFYKSPERLRQLRERAYQKFLADYTTGQGTRYVFGELPRLPFADKQFDLVLVSYLLLVYEDQFSYDFHRNSILEILRVAAGEARIYPLVTFEAQRSKYLDRLKSDPELRPLRFEEVATDFEFLANSNSFLRIRHAK